MVFTHLFLMDVPEKIITPRLILRVPHGGDGPGLHEAILDGYEDYVKWLNWPFIPPSQEKVEEECRKHHAQFILREDIRYLITLKDSGKIIGRCGYPFLQAMWQIPQFGISYFISKTHRRQGFGVETAQGLTRVAFECFKAKKVEIKVDEENMAGRKIPEALNFMLEYTQKGGWPRRDEKLADLYTYAIFQKEDLPPLDVHF